MRQTKKSFVLRKIRGRFDAVLIGSTTHVVGAPRGSNAFGAFGNLLSAVAPLLMVVLAIAALFAFGQAHHATHVAALSPLALSGFAVGETADVSKLVSELNTAFIEFRNANDERLKAIEKKGSADPLLEAKVDKANTAISDLEDKIKAIETAQARVAAGGGLMTAEAKDEIKNAREFFSLVKGERVDAVSEAQVETTRNYRKAFDTWMRRGLTDPSIYDSLSVGSQPDGGQWVLPDTTGKIVQMVYETSAMRQIADIQAIGTDALEGKYDNDEAGDSGWTSEGGPRQTETGTPQVGAWRIEPGELWALPKTSQKNLDDSMMDVETSTSSMHDRWSYVCGDWYVRSTPSRRLRPGTPNLTGTPATSNAPDAGTTPTSALRNVVLPLPFGPTSPRISPSRTSRLTPSTARTPPKLTRMLAALRIAGPSTVAPFTAARA